MLKLFNTASRKIEDFVPLHPPKVGMYTCGPTVYLDAHIGNLRRYVMEDILLRTLELEGYEVTRVLNITDVGHLTDDADAGEDKMESSAAKSGMTVWDIAKRYTDQFLSDAESLNIKIPTGKYLCKATDHIPEQIELIKLLESKGFTYTIRDGVYFDTAKFPSYGSFSGQKLEDKEAGARVTENPEKHNKSDFALWKLSPKDAKRQMEWDSPWGVGFPGWHIECSAMAHKYLGQPIDLHCGGIDHVPVHHENEIAQSEPLMDAPPMAEMWVHGGLLNFENRKMSKSLGNFEPLTDLLKRHDPFAIRLLFLQTGYQKPMNFTEESIAAAKSSLDKLVSVFKRAESAEIEPAGPGGTVEAPAAHRAALFAHLDNDMNTAGALGILHDLAGDLLRYDDPRVRDEGLSLMREVFGLFGIEAALDRERPVEFDEQFVERLRRRLGPELHPSTGSGQSLNGESPEAAIESVIAKRNEARKNKDFALGDRLRDALAAEGVALKDSKDGTTWTVAGA